MINCAIIGFGNWGKKISSQIYESKKFNILSVYDLEYENNSFHNIEKCKNIYDILENKIIDTVFILLPNHLHGEYAKLCAKYKKNIFVEKPICNTKEEALEVLEICKKNNCKIMVGHNVKYYAIFQKVKKMINENKVGKVYHVETNRSRPIWKDISETSWRYKKLKCNGGPLIQMGLHMIDTIEFLFGYNSKEIKLIGTNNYLKSENYESYDVIGVINDNITFYLYSSYLPAETFYINIYGEKGTIFADVFKGLFYQKIDSFESQKIEFENNNPEFEEINEFYNILKNKEITYQNINQAIHDVEEIEKILNE